ncbi:hypothetical protein BDF20DRAFT_823712 [Mycotypha africana]|uniref:uncharacterized protein n=1 Tax=Mycotypha africana TaxID=64632 RepID=UPI002300FB30|nr:uncharacterized protein BDF20DRAFT_823712 [Mycotypha africana]KAI8973463.1 hypothetical protein BDF20DRAFT_823712 [Mycotypha africana]
MTALLNDEIVGFVCTSLTTSDLVTDESMSVHEPTGKTICLHSVCTSPDHREKGIATQLLRQWIDRIKIVNEEFRKEHDGEKKYNRIAMISRPALLGLYGRVGFKELGISPIIHGPDPWIDAVLDL